MWNGRSPAWLGLSRGYDFQDFTESTGEGAWHGQSTEVLHSPVVSDTFFPPFPPHCTVGQASWGSFWGG